MTTPSELTGLAFVALVALAFGMAMTRLKQPPVVGYILAGVLLGHSVFPVLENRDQIAFLADLGVLMLLFFIGIELELGVFLKVWKTAVTTAAIQIAGSLVVMWGLSHLLGWSTGVAVLFGFVVALSSTAVGVKLLESTGAIGERSGQLTLGILIAQDLAVVPMLVVIGGLGGGSLGLWSLAEVVAAVLILALLIRYLTTGPKRVLPFSRLVGGHPDLLPLAGLVYCFGAAVVSGLLGLSAAFGAFLAGLYIGNSTGRRRMIVNVRPIQSVLLMLFFLSIGLLVDLEYIWANLWSVLAVLLFVSVVKTVLNVGALHLLRLPWAEALIGGLVLAQIGEFSFVLGAEGVAAGLIGTDEHNLIIAVAALSLLISPLWQVSIQRLLGIAFASITSLPVTLRLLSGRRGIRAWARTRRALRALVARLRRRRAKGAGDTGFADGPKVIAPPKDAGPRDP